MDKQLEDFVNAVARSFSQATEIVLMRDTLSPGQFEFAYRSLRELLEQYDKGEKHWNSLPHEPATFGQYQRAGDNALHVGILFAKSVFNSLEAAKVYSLGMPVIDDLSPAQWRKWSKAAAKEIGTVTFELTGWSMSAFRRDTELILRKMSAEVESTSMKEPDDWLAVRNDHLAFGKTKRNELFKDEPDKIRRTEQRDIVEIRKSMFSVWVKPACQKNYLPIVL